MDLNPLYCAFLRISEEVTLIYVYSQISLYLYYHRFQATDDWLSDRSN